MGKKVIELKSKRHEGYDLVSQSEKFELNDENYIHVGSEEGSKLLDKAMEILGDNLGAGFTSHPLDIEPMRILYKKNTNQVIAVRRKQVFFINKNHLDWIM
jgi:hypothetical protein